MRTHIQLQVDLAAPQSNAFYTHGNLHFCTVNVVNITRIQKTR